MKRFSIIPAILMLILMAGCDPVDISNEMIAVSGPTMGTEFHVKYFLPENSAGLARPDEVEAGIHTRLARINQLMSTYLDDSELSLFNRSPVNQWVELSAETLHVISLAQQISEATQGAFDITVGPLVNLWGFGPDYHQWVVPAKQAIIGQLKSTGYRHLQLDQTGSRLLKELSVNIDLSAIAKGYAVDYVADYLTHIGIKTYMVEVGGEIRAQGLKPGGEPWRIAIEVPRSDSRAVQRIINVTDKAIATSGDYRNYFEKNGQRFSHTIDPLTGYPVTHNLASVTVISDTAARADALATAFTVMGADKALSFANTYNIAALFIIKDAEDFVEKTSRAFQPMLQRGL